MFIQLRLLSACVNMHSNQKKLPIRLIMSTSEEATVSWKLASEYLPEFKFHENN